MARLQWLMRVPPPISLALAAAAVVLFVNAYVSYENTRRLLDTNSWLVHTAVVLERASRLNFQLAQAESAKRGFLLTGDETYLAPLESARKLAKERLEDLQSRTADNEIQQGRLNRMSALVTEKLAEIDSTIVTYRERGPQAALAIVRKPENRVLMDEIQILVADLRADEERLHAVRDQNLRSSTQVAALSAIVATVVALSQLVLSWYLIARYLDRRRATEAELARVNAHLEDTVLARTKELSKLSQHLMTVREEEKAHIARELHDELGSSLTAARMDLAWIAQRVADNPEVAQRLVRVSEVLRSTVDLSRRIIHDLRPPLLDSVGLSAAIEAHVSEVAKRAGVEVELDVVEQLPELTTDCPIALFRILQEALTNVLRHSKAKRVKVTLRQQGKDVILEVIDDGIGMADDILANPMSHGLLGMRERAAQIGGKLSIARGAERTGTVVRVTLPCVAEQTA